jgi:hypothetical protein
MVTQRQLAYALMNLGPFSPSVCNQIIADLGRLADKPVRDDRDDDEALLAIGTCAAYDHLDEAPMAMFLVAKDAIVKATQSQIDVVVAKQAAIPPGYDS